VNHTTVVTSGPKKTQEDVRSSFHERGYLGPVRVFGEAECKDILARLREEQSPPLDWGKGWAASSVDYYDIATDERILDLVTSLLGKDVLLWGASLVESRAGSVHPWHTDVESSSPEGETLSVWIGLAQTNARSSLKVVPFSHRFGVTLQQVVQEAGKDDRQSVTDAEVARLAQERDADSGVVAAPSVDGEAVLFDGRLWHASENRLDEGTRSALLLQYATPATAIRIPNLGRLTWPFELYRAPKPPCIVVSGHDAHGVNRTIPGPIPRKGSLAALSTWIHSLQLPLEQDPEVGWKPHGLFRGSTPVIEDMSCHASVLDPGRQPHPRHRHDEEEIILILDGEAELVFEDASTRAGRGTFAFYPAGFAHTIRNSSGAPVTYLMFKWSSDPGGQRKSLGYRLVSLAEAQVDGSQEGFSTNAVLDGETRYLRHLNAHITTLQPGAGYDPHADAYDVGIVVFEGSVETLGERVGPRSVIFYSAGELHGMRNVGETPAVYLVFEFHGRHSRRRQPAADRSGRLWRVARDPRRWKPAALHVGRRLAASGKRRLARRVPLR